MTEKEYYNIIVQGTAYSWMNLNNKKSVFYDMLETTMDFIMFWPLAAMLIYAFIHENIFVYKALLCFPAVLYLTVSRNYIKKNYFFVLSFIPLFITAYFITGPLGERIPVLAYLAIASVLSMSKRSKEVVEYRNEVYLITGNGVLLAEYIAAAQFKYILIRNMVVLGCIVFTLLCLIYIHITRTKKLMEWEKQTSRDSLKRIGSASRSFLLGLGCSFLVIALILFGGGMTGAGENLIFRFLRWLAGLFKITVVPKQSTGGQSSPDMTQMLEELGKGTTPVSKIFTYIIEFLLWGLIITMAVVFSYLILKFIYESIKSYMLGRKARDEEKESMLDINDVVESMKERFNTLRKGISISTVFSNNRRIRKIYYKIVVKNKKAGTAIEKSYTPAIIERVVEEDSNKDISEATAIYEKARYGNGDCGDEDVEAIKQFKP